MRTSLTLLVTASLLVGCVESATHESDDTDQSTTALAEGNLFANPSFEVNTASWSSWQGSLTRVAVSGAPNGSYAARVNRVSGSSFSIDDASNTVLSAPAGATYTASVYVRAASASSVGKPGALALREWKNGAEVKRWTAPTVTLTSSWQKVTISGVTPTAGNALDAFFYQSSATSGDAFFVDAFDLRRASSTPADAGAPPPSDAGVPPSNDAGAPPAAGAGKHVPNFGAGASLVYATDYTNRDERDEVGGAFWLQYPSPNEDQVWNPTFLAPVQAPWAASKKAIRAIVHKGDNWLSQGYPRSELSMSNNRVEGGAHYFLSFGFMFPAENESFIDNNTSQMVALLQLHQPENTGSPPLAFSLANKTLKMDCGGGNSTTRTNFTSNALYPSGGVPVGQLVAVDMEYVPRNDANGLLKIWLDGVQVLNKTGPNAYTSSGNVGYWKQGLYDYWNIVPNTLTIYLDDLIIRKQ